ncbi:hypothetical protein [Methanobrevibacter sp.]|uniref:hypothetical protein n=1 Tax=Methanobrevibacter sp. TaxID=66852 RepID=UPI00388F92BD
MKKNFLFIICLILLIVSVSSVSASADVNQTISDETGDSIALANDDGNDLDDNNLSYVSDINMQSYIDDGDCSDLNISSSDINDIDLSNLNISDALSKVDLSNLNITDVLSKIVLSRLNISDVNPSDLADLTLPNVTKYYHGPERLEATYTILDQPVENVTIHFYVNDVEYKVNTSSAGKASIALNLNPGVYDVMARSLVIFQTATVTIKSTIEAKDVIKYYKNATQYYAKFIDGQGNPLKNTDVKFNINGVEYTRKTNASGVAKLNINLNSGTYTITATNPVTNEMRSNMIQVYGLIAENRDLTKYFKNESQYSIRLFDDQGNPVGAGVTALFNIHGVFYTRTSDENGYVTLNINLSPGDYIVTAEFNGYKVSNNIKVLPVLIASDLTKAFLDLTPFTVKLVNGRGDALINRVITFNINGVMYNRTTDLFGIATLNINLWPGEYIITSRYDEIGAVTSNKVTVSSIFG